MTTRTNLTPRRLIGTQEYYDGQNRPRLKAEIWAIGSDYVIQYYDWRHISGFECGWSPFPRKGDMKETYPKGVHLDAIWKKVNDRVDSFVNPNALTEEEREALSNA